VSIFPGQKIADSVDFVINSFDSIDGNIDWHDYAFTGKYSVAYRKKPWIYNI
jgi:hypothetical protein